MTKLSFSAIILVLILCMFSTLGMAAPIGNAIPAQVNATAAGSLVPTTKYNTLSGFTVTSGASAGYLLIFDAASVPADGTVTPQNCIKMAATSTIAQNFAPAQQFSNGIVFVYSTTGCFTKTISSTAFFNVEVQ